MAIGVTKKEYLCPICKSRIKVQVAYCGFKARCYCSPNKWGLGDSEQEAVDSLIVYLEKMR